MKKVKITDGLLKKLQKRLFKVVKREYKGDGLYCEIDKVEITLLEGYSVDYTVRYGKMADGKCLFQHTVVIPAGDGNIDFLAGQFFQLLLIEEYEPDGNK